MILLRLSGKRTLSKMNVFDFVFVVALGSTLATAILSPDVTLADGVLVLAVLIGLQILLSWLCVQSQWLEAVINGEPALLLHHGQFLHETMRRQRVTEEELRAAVRSQGLTTIDEVESIVLETDGTISVTWRKVQGTASSLRDVPGHPEQQSHSSANAAEQRIQPHTARRHL